MPQLESCRRHRAKGASLIEDEFYVTTSFLNLRLSAVTTSQIDFPGALPTDRPTDPTERLLVLPPPKTSS